MNRSFKKVWKETLIIALCFILLGCFMLIKPEMTLTFFSDIVGALILMLAIMAFYRHYKMQKMFTFDLAYGVVCVLGACLLFFNKEFLANLIPIVLGIVMIANSIFKIQYIFDLKKAGAKRWYVSLILSLIKITLGILLIVNPFESMFKITQIIGVFVILFAVCDLADLIIIKVCLNKSFDEDGYTDIKPVQDVIEDAEIKEIDDDK